jgi:hypothetical protein
MATGRPTEIQELFDELQSNRQFESMEELQAFAEGFMSARGERRLDDFDGLSPSHMHEFLYRPFDCPELVEFPDELGVEPDGPLATLTREIIAAIGPKGLKLTPKGNLPRALSQAAALNVMGEVAYAEFTSIVKIRSEEDYRDLFHARNVAQMAGLLRKENGSTAAHEALSGAYAR